MEPDTSPKRLGPYTAWTYGPGRAFDFFASERASHPHILTGIIERPDGHEPHSAPEPLCGGGTSVDLLAPTLWAGLAEPRFLPFIVGGASAQELTDASIDALFAGAPTAGIRGFTGGGYGPKAPKTRITMGAPIRQDTVMTCDPSAPSLTKCDDIDACKPLIVLGIIDDGIPFAHSALEGQIEAVWMQGGPADPEGRVRFGREITGADIARLRAEHGTDEDNIYRAVGALGGMGPSASSLIGDASHGAHTLGALAEGSDAQARIIAVDLPPEATWDTSGHSKEALVLAALHYIFDRADALAALHGRDTLPMILNFSYGYSGGSHDATGALEAAMDELVEARRQKAPTAFTMPAGNMFVDRSYAEVSLGAGASSRPLPWCLPPDDRTSSFLEVWLPEGADISALTLTLNGPGSAYGPPGKIAGRFDGGDASDTELHLSPVLWNGRTVGQIACDCTRGGRWRIVLALAPTEAASAPTAPHGKWHLVFDDARGKGSDLLLRCRIQRDISYGRGYTGARQSYFDDPENALFDEEGRAAETDSDDALVRRHGSLSGMATGKTSLVIGAAKGWGSGAELYSGAPGEGEPTDIDLSATVSESLSEVGRLGLASRTGARHRMTGTSAAAPAVARALRDVIASVPAGSAKDNYLSVLDDAGKIKARQPDAAKRVGAYILK